MLIMLRRNDKVRVQIQNALNELIDKERDKKKRKKLQELYLTEDEKELLPQIVKALGYVEKASTLLCGNDVTLAAADRVRCKA